MGDTENTLLLCGLYLTVRCIAVGTLLALCFLAQGLLLLLLPLFSACSLPIIIIFNITTTGVLCLLGDLKEGMSGVDRFNKVLEATAEIGICVLVVHRVRAGQEAHERLMQRADRMDGVQLQSTVPSWLALVQRALQNTSEISLDIRVKLLRWCLCRLPRAFTNRSLGTGVIKSAEQPD
ncbi:MAG: hypothetical protein Q9198_007916 [Flavoplaca austrocitrina]